MARCHTDPLFVNLQKKVEMFARMLWMTGPAIYGQLSVTVQTTGLTRWNATVQKPVDIAEPPAYNRVSRRNCHHHVLGSSLIDLGCKQVLSTCWSKCYYSGSILRWQILARICHRKMQHSFTCIE